MIPLVIALVLLNATLPGQTIPLEVTTTLSDPNAIASGSGASTAEVAPASATPTLLDGATIATIVGIAGALFAAYKKNESRTNATADTSINLAQSLKATDKGTADIANNLATALEKLSQTSPEAAKALESCKQTAAQNAQAWNKDLKEYYENQPPPTSQDIGLDKVKTKLKSVNQMTTKTPDPS